MASVAAPAGSAVEPSAMSVGKAATPDPDPPDPAGFSAADAPVSEAPLVASAPTPPLETQVQLASLSTSDPVKEDPKPTVRPVETPDECLVAEICIDEYLWSLYERTPKTDVNKVTEQTKETIKKEWQNAHYNQNHYEVRLGGLHVEGSDSGTKGQHIAQGLRDRRPGSRL
jgi:hypothetical protein